MHEYSTGRECDKSQQLLVYHSIGLEIRVYRGVSDGHEPVRGDRIVMAMAIKIYNICHVYVHQRFTSIHFEFAIHKL